MHATRPHLFGIGEGLVRDFFDLLAGFVADAAGFALKGVAAVLSSTTAPPFDQAWFVARYEAIDAIAASIALLCLIVAVLHSLVRGELGGLLRSVALRLPISLLLAAAGARLATLALAVGDSLSAALAGAASGSVHDDLARLALGVGGLGTAVPGVSFLVAVLALLASATLWIELAVRDAALLVCVALLPLVLATAVWSPAVVWSRRLAETMAALILAKPVIILCLSLGLSAIAQLPDDAGGVVAGAAVLCLACAMPFVLLRLVPMLEGAAIGGLEQVRGRASSAATRAAGRAVVLASSLPAGVGEGATDIGFAAASGPGDLDVEGTALGSVDASSSARSPLVARPARAQDHRIEHDDMGPRLVWRPR